MTASRDQVVVFLLCSFKARERGGKVATGFAVIQYEQQLPGFYVSAFLDQHCLYCSRERGMGFKAVNGFDLAVGGDGTGDFLTHRLDDRDADTTRPKLNVGPDSDQYSQQDGYYYDPSSAGSAERAI